MYLLILDKEQNVIGEVKTKTDPQVQMYFVYAIAHAFGVPLTQVVTREKYDRDRGIYRCSICGENTVDAENGFDTCESCLPR